MSCTLARGSCRAVGQDRDVDAGRNPALQLGDQRLDAVDGLDDVGVGLLGDDQQHRRLRVEHGRGARVARALLDLGDVRQAHDGCRSRLDDDALVVVGVAQLGVGLERDRPGWSPSMMPSGARRWRLTMALRTSSMLRPMERAAHRVDAHADGRLLGAR